MKTWGKLQPFQKTGTLLFQCASRPDLLPAKRPTELAFHNAVNAILSHKELPWN